MKQTRPISTFNLVVIFILAYIAALIAGHFFVYYANFGMHRKRYMNICNSYATIYESVRHVGGVDHVGVGLVYLPDGEVTYTFGKISFYSMRQDFIPEKGINYLSRAFSGSEVYEFVPFAPNKSELGYTSLIFSMVPVHENGNITGVLCYVFEAQNFLALSIGYLIIITIFFAILMIFIIGHNKRIIQFDAAQKKYVDNVTHELKTPVASIKALTEALTDNMDKNENEREIYYGLILKEANRQERMIKNVLELSKIQSGFEDFSASRIPAKVIFEEICEKYQTRCLMQDIKFEIGDEIQQLPMLKTNANYMKQLMDILLSNALKFADAEEGIVSLHAKEDKRKVIVCIEDNGIGISAEDLPHICERFYRSSEASSYSGSGIGLAIADEIIKNLNESMWFDSAPGEGTRVYFTIQAET